MSNEGVKHLLVQVNPVFFNARFSEYCHDNVATSVEQPGTTIQYLFDRKTKHTGKNKQLYLSQLRTLQ